MWRPGRVARVLREQDDIEELEVQVDGKSERALNYPVLTGRALPGDTVVLNTTAARLGLGTGGYHFVHWIQGRTPEARIPGHVMKMRYTPLQVACLAVESPESPFHGFLLDEDDLGGMPVVAASLHSQVGPAAAGIKARSPHLRVAYIMTDGGALPMAFSDNVRALRHAGLLDVTITAGHAFGGQMEAVNLHSALLAAKMAARVDVAIVSIGPGVVGTGTPLGTTALQQGEALNAAVALGGRPIAVPRVGFSDPRPRHQGLSHHTLTVLGRVFLGHCIVALPLEARGTPIPAALWRGGITSKHRIILDDGQAAVRLLEELGVPSTSMGRDPSAEPLLFLAAGAAGRLAARLARKE
ncbi:MAG: DUF3866 family protein [Bacillota bacterium]